jgi:hypothetical protein
MIDIVFPDGNEKEFEKIADRLGLKLCFVYEKTSEKNTTAPNHEFTASTKPGKSDLAIHQSDGQDRGLIEANKTDLVYDLEQVRKDKLHRRGSNLDKALADIIARKGKMVAFSFSSILNAKPKDRAKVLGRMRHNYKLCKKAKCNVVIATFSRSPYGLRADLASFGIMLGMHPSEAKKALSSIESFILMARKKRQGKAIDGVEEIE